jgi:ferredoxin-type protein NapH
VLWEDVSPVNVVSRSVIFLTMVAIWLGLGVFLFAVLMKVGWWRICPTGALYGLLGGFSLFRVRIENLEKCDNCNACYEVCPEPQVLSAPLKKDNDLLMVRSGQCSNCGRCIDVCPHAVFRFGRRF